MTSSPVEDLPEIVAHRGNASEFPENTLQALQSAVDLGVRYVEFDVQLTADRVPVVFHDSDLVRVAGRTEIVHELYWSDLAEIPIGEPERFGNRFAFTYPSSLLQVVDAIAGWHDVTAFVEVKRSSLRHFGRETVLRRIAETLRPVLDRCVLISFDLASVRILKLMTGARVGWVIEKYDDATLAAATAAPPDYLFCNLARLPEDTSRLWVGPWQWAIYEVRDVRTAQQCRSLGAALVETMTVRGLQTAYRESRRHW